MSLSLKSLTLFGALVLMAAAHGAPGEAGRSDLRILSPRPFMEFMADEAISLRLQLPAGWERARVIWRSDLQGTLGTGASLSRPLRGGVHQLSARAVLAGQLRERSVQVRVAPYRWAGLSTGGYRNAVIGGRTVGGETVLLVAGKHTQNFPFDDPSSKFDNLLLKIGDDSYHVTARRIDALAVRPLGNRLVIKYSGRATRLTGVGTESATVSLSFTAELITRPYALDDLVPVWNLALLRWAPRAVTGCAGDLKIELAGRTHVVDGRTIFGHLEEAYLTSTRKAPVGYRYWAVLDVERRRLYLSMGLDPIGPLAALNGPGNLATRAAALSFIVSFPREAHRSPVKLPVPLSSFAYGPAERRFGPVIDLGPARLRRTITEFTQVGGGAYWGLEEEFVR